MTSLRTRSGVADGIEQIQWQQGNLAASRLLVQGTTLESSMRLRPKGGPQTARDACDRGRFSEETG